MRYIRVISIVMALCLLLTGCFYTGIFDELMDEGHAPRGTAAYNSMEYTRPDMQAFETALDDICRKVSGATVFSQVETALMEFDQVYSDFLTNYHLSNIRYSADLTDAYWEAEYNFCMENTATVDQGMERLYHTLAKCRFRETLETEEYFGQDFFDDYDGELLYDDHFVSLNQQEAALEAQYYDLCDQASNLDPSTETYYSSYGESMLELYVQMVALRQEIAAYAGYESFADYTYDQYYGRDFTPDQAAVYMQDLGNALKPVSQKLLMSEHWMFAYQRTTETATFSYVEKAAKAMGGDIAEAFNALKQYGLYDIGYSENKFDASFEVFLPSYAQPFIFMNASGYETDKLTFAHEFGHFANDYVCGGSYCGIDVKEVHSQAFEYLSLSYGKGSDSMKQYKMLEGLLTMLQCAAHGLFELRVYELTGDELTVDNVLAVYDSTVAQFGLDEWGLEGSDVAQISHFYTSPMYMVSYVVSNDLALQVYQKELAKSGDGLQLYKRMLESGESGIVTFAGDYGVESPFTPGRPQALAQFFREMLGVDEIIVTDGDSIGLSFVRIIDNKKCAVSF